MGEGLLRLFCYLRYLTDKVINDLDLLEFLAVYLLNLAHQNLADQPVQHRFVQLLNGGVFADFTDKCPHIAFLLVCAAHHQGYATQRKMTHDFRHHIAALSGMLQGGETQQAQDYLAALQEQQTERALMVNTHNSVIDAVLNQKGYAAQKQHIDIQFEVNDLSPLQIELIDCTVVLGNLLDNAIEACLKLEEAKRRIEVSVLRDEAYADGDAKLYVSIINTSLPVHIEKDCIATTKLEPHLHGFGLPCAKELLRRNNAFYTMDYHDGAFQFCFEWPDVARNSCVHA